MSQPSIHFLNSGASFLDLNTIEKQIYKQEGEKKQLSNYLCNTEVVEMRKWFIFKYSTYILDK